MKPCLQQSSLLPNIQAIPSPLVSTSQRSLAHALVRGPFQVSLFSMAVVDHVFPQEGTNTQSWFFFGGEVE